jgi:predicted flap endonuclease-1-like 5' DNA nuclease
MDAVGFRRFLRGKGKKDKVVDGLVSRVMRFGEYLDAAGKSPDEANACDISNWAAGQDGKLGSFKNGLRAVALYYSYTENDELARKASEMRRGMIDSDGKKFKLKNLLGIAETHLEKLEAEGITTTEQMILRGRTPADRRMLSRLTGIPGDEILECVKMADLTRIAGIKGVRARLYHDAGLDTLDKLAESDHSELREFLVRWVEETGFDGIAPLPKELVNTIKEAGKLERLIEY